MSDLYKTLNCIKKEKDKETRLRRLREVCSDKCGLDACLEIAKHESTTNISGTILLTAVAALIITVLSAVLIALIPDAWQRIISLFIMFIIIIVVLIRQVKFEFGDWTELYYDLIDLRVERMEPALSKLDRIISNVEALNQKLDNFGKTVISKLDAVEKEIISTKRK